MCPALQHHSTRGVPAAIPTQPVYVSGNLKPPLSVGFQYTAIITQHVYVSGNLLHHSTCEVFVSNPHSTHPCVTRLW
ncbi:unnamed protein product [Ectocarpus sp. CCAP 1310/34]|nr:unnamed protein product [Ectocarpus sp. CCAP 1310/34]